MPNSLRQRIRAHRWNFTAPHWWKPQMTRHKLASGPFGGWHLWWGPFHAWNVTTHNRTRERGLSWR